MNWISHPQEHWLALLIGAIVIVGFAALLWSILNGSRSLRQVALPVKTYRRILIPATAGHPFDDETVSLACRLAGGGTGAAPSSGLASIVLAYIIEVPRALALNAPLPEEESHAQRVLDAATTSVRGCGLQPVAQVRKARGATDEILRAAHDEHADLLVLAALPTTPNSQGQHSFSTLSQGVARRAPCEVVLARAAATTL